MYMSAVNSSLCVSSMATPEMYAVFVQGSGVDVGVARFAARPVMAAGGGGGGAARAYLADPTRWGAWAHQGHRLWASMAEEFWVYVYKVQRCPQPCSHDWTACPYAHKGERARRRDPRRFSYVGVSCPDYRAHPVASAGAGAGGGGGGGQMAPAACARGLKCRYAHGVFELWLHPSRFRTRMCEAGQLCPRPICFFAHSVAELRRDDATAAATAAVVTPFLPRDIHQPFDMAITSMHATAPEYNRSPFRAYYDHAATPTASSSAAAVPSIEPGGVPKCSRCAEEEESMVHDYPHVDLIMDLVS